MLTTFITALSTNVALGWIMRRVGELGGLLTFLFSIVLALPPGYQDVILMLLTGRGGELTVSAVIGIVVYGFTQWRSWRSTVKPHMVTREGKKHDIPEL